MGNTITETLPPVICITSSAVLEAQELFSSPLDYSYFFSCRYVNNILLKTYFVCGMYVLPIPIIIIIIVLYGELMDRLWERTNTVNGDDKKYCLKVTARTCVVLHDTRPAPTLQPSEPRAWSIFTEFWVYIICQVFLAYCNYVIINSKIPCNMSFSCIISSKLHSWSGMLFIFKESLIKTLTRVLNILPTQYLHKY